MLQKNYQKICYQSMLCGWKPHIAAILLQKKIYIWGKIVIQVGNAKHVEKIVLTKSLNSVRISL